jgi:hypothetical protein
MNNKKIIRKENLIQTLGLFSIIWILASSLFGLIFVVTVLLKGIYFHFILDIILITAFSVVCVVEAWILKMWLAHRIVIL